MNKKELKAKVDKLDSPYIAFGLWWHHCDDAEKDCACALGQVFQKETGAPLGSSNPLVYLEEEIGIPQNAADDFVGLYDKGCKAEVGIDYGVVPRETGIRIAKEAIDGLDLEDE